MKKQLTLIATCFCSLFFAQQKMINPEGAKIDFTSSQTNLPLQVSFYDSKHLSEAQFGDWMQHELTGDANIAFLPVKTEPDQLGMIHSRYIEYYKGHSIDGSMIIVHSKNGEVKSFNGDWFKDISLSNAPALTEQQALQYALTKVNAQKYKWENKAEEAHMKDVLNNPAFTYYPKGELVIVPTVNQKEKTVVYQYAFKFNIYAELPLSRANVYVDAASGKIIKEQNLICTANAVGSANTKYSGTQAITTDSYAGGYRLRETSRGLGVETYNLNNSSTYTNTDFTNTTNTWTITTTNQAATDAHWGAEMTYDFYKQTYNRNSIDNAGYKLLSYVHYSNNYVNAFWDGQRMTYGDGSTSQGFTIMTALDVCGHEITHGLVSNTANLNGGGSGEADALNEGFADIFGTTIEAFARPTQHDWIMGKDIMPSGAGIRNMSNPNQLQQPDTYQGTYWDNTGEPHTNNGPCIYWYYLLCAGGSGTNDNSQAFSVSGITMAEANAIAYRALTVYMTSSTTYANVRNYTIQAAKDLYGNCSNEVIQTTNAWHAVGVGAVYVASGCSALDAGITAVINPAPASTTCNNNVTPQIRLINTGTVTLTSATITYKMDAGANQVYNWTGSLASGTSTAVSLNAFTGLTAGAHTFSATVSLPNGSTDQNASNNTQTSTFTVTAAPTGSALPFTEGFEGTTFVPAGWLKTSTNTLNAANTWTRVANTTGIAVTPASTACAKMDNYSGSTDITGQRDALRSPALTFASANSSLKLKFDVSHRRYATTSDSLNVWISTDCGGTWTRIYNKGGATLSTVTGTVNATYTPTANAQWRRDSVSLSAYAGQPSVYIKFESVSAYGNNVYLDNINVAYTSTTTASPAASFSTASTGVCAGTAMQLTDQSTNAPTTWTWTATSSTGVSFSNTHAQNPTVTFSNAGTYTLTLIAGNTGGNGTTTKTVTVNALPATSVNSPTICSGQTTTLTASGASTYSWNTGATGASLSQNPVATTVYTVTGTSAAGCVKTATATITVKATPTVAVNSASVCQGSSVVLTASGATTYSWNTSATTSTINVTPTGTTNYTVTGTTNGCVRTNTTTVTVTALPTVSAGSSTICAGQSATLTASGATSYSWNTGATGSSLSVSPSSSANYTVTGTSAGCSKTSTASVTVKALPPVSAGNASVCQGSPAVLTAGGATGYVWSTSATTSTISVSPSSTTSYTVTGTSNGCSNTAVGIVTVNALPTVNANTATVCAGGSAVLTATGANSYTWSTGANTPGISVSPSSTASYTVTGASTSGCLNSHVTQVTVTSAPGISVNSATICTGGNTSLSASGVSTYTWNTGANTSGISVSPSSTTVYTVSGNVPGCPATLNTATVTVNQRPVVSLAAIGGPLCSGNPVVTLSGTPAGGTYAGTGVSGNSFDPSVSGTGTFTLSYSYTNGNSCSNTDSKSVTVSTCTGIDNQSAGSISIYPNPAHELLNIKLTNASEHYVVEVYDAIGKLVYSAEANLDVFTVSTGSFAKGLYTLRITADQKQLVSRFIKD